MLKKTLSMVLLISLILVSTFAGHVGVLYAAVNIYYVSSTGNDTTGDGSFDNPWATIQKAADIMVAGDVCEIRGGTYRETVTPAGAGTNESKIIFRAYGQEKVIISGTEPITGWVQDSGNIYQAPMNWSLGAGNQVFVNGQMLYTARWPNNTGTLLAQTYATAEDGTLSSITDSTIPEAIDPAGCGIWYRGGAEWMASDTSVTAYDAASKTMTIGGGGSANANYDPKAGTKYYIFGMKQLLDAENEFWYDQNQLYLYNMDEAALQQATIEVKKRKYGLDLSGKANIEIDGLAFFATSIKTDDNTNGICIKHVKATYVAHSDRNSGGSPADEDNGILIRGTNNEISSCEIAYSSAALLNMYGSHNSMINCHIHDGNYATTWSGLVSAKGTNQYIGYNTISNAIREPLLIRLLQKSIVEHNDISNGGLGTSDNGLIYACNTDGMGTEIRYNKVHGSFADAWGSGIYLDNQCSHFLVHHNVIWDIPSGGDPLHLNYPSEFNLVFNNTIAAGGNLTGMGFFYGYYNTWFYNNIAGGQINHPQTVARGNNITGGTDPRFVDAANHDYRLTADSPAIDMGRAIAGVNDSFTGIAPDIGAYEYGQDDFKAGHDFNQSPAANLDFSSTIYMDRVANGSFEAGNTSAWQIAEGTKSELLYDEMGAWVKLYAANTRTQDYSLKLTGSSIDWSAVTPLASAAAQQAVSLKVTEDSTYYYFCLEGSGFTSGRFSLYINADQDESTGYLGNSGNEYMINATSAYVAAYRYTGGTGYAWSWTPVGSSAYSENLNAIEIRVTKAAFADPSPLAPVFGVQGVYNDSSADFVCGLPAGGGYASYTQTGAETAAIILDGATADWAAIASIADVPVQKAVNLKVSDDADVIYFHIEGSGMAPYYQILLNTDNDPSTGFMAATWAQSGFDYRIQNGVLFSHPANDADGDAWVRIEDADVSGKATSAMIDAKVAKSVLNLNGNLTIPVAFYSVGADWSNDCALPASGDVPGYVLTGNASSTANTGEISQTLQNLLPETSYVLAGWAKSASADSSVILGVKDYGGTAIEQEIKNIAWTSGTIEFTTGPGQTTATIYVQKKTPGETYVDDISVGLPLDYATPFDRLLNKMIEARTLLASHESGLPQEILDRLAQQIQAAAAVPKDDMAAIENALTVLAANMHEFAQRNLLYRTVNLLQAVCDSAVEGEAAGQYPIGSKQALQDVIDLARVILVDFTLHGADVEKVILALGQQGDLFKMQVKAEDFDGVPRADMATLLKDAQNWLSTYTISGEESIFTLQNSKYTGAKYGNELFEFNMSYDFTQSNSEWPGIMLRSQTGNFLWNGDTTYFIIFKYDKWELQKWVAGVQDKSFFITTPNTQFTGALPTKMTVGALNVDNGVRIVCFVAGQLVYDVVDTADNRITAPGYFGFETNAATTMSPIRISPLKPITALAGASFAEAGQELQLEAGIYCIPASISGGAGFKEITIKYDSQILSFVEAQAINGTNPAMTVDASQSGLVSCQFDTFDTTRLILKFDTLSVAPLSMVGILQCVLKDGAGNEMSTEGWLKLLQVSEPPVMLFSDGFAGKSPADAWEITGGVWQQNKGVLNQVSATDKDPIKAIISRSQVEFPAELTITAKVRVDNWKDGAAAIAGVSLLSNAQDGCGYNLVFHKDHHTVQFLDEKVAWGPSYGFEWEDQAWYWFKLKMADGTLYGKVWRDGDSEPENWPYVWAHSGREGYPALSGGSCANDPGPEGAKADGLAKVSFDDVSVLGISVEKP